MFPSVLRTLLKTTASVAAIGGACLAGMVLLDQAPAQAEFLPAYTTTNSLGEYTPGGQGIVESSFGFFFDTTANVPINGLGFASQQAWGNQTSYTVTLWSFDKGGATAGDYTELASKVFTQGDPYDFRDGYFWQTISTINLPESLASDPGNLRGYVIAAIGDFSDSPGNVQYESGTPTFDPQFLIAGNGFNYAPDAFGFFPIPIFDGGIGTDGYFNPNLSYVPGPLPILGAAAGFSWSRRLRSRIRSSR